MALQNITKQNISDEVYGQFIDAIMNGEWKPPATFSGSALPPASLIRAEKALISSAAAATVSCPGQL